MPQAGGGETAAMTEQRGSQRLLESGVYVQAIRPPTVPDGASRLRIVPTAAHDAQHVERALRAFKALASER